MSPLKRVALFIAQLGCLLVIIASYVGAKELENPTPFFIVEALFGAIFVILAREALTTE